MATPDGQAIWDDDVVSDGVSLFRLKLTPRQRAVLQARLRVNADGLYDDIDARGDATVYRDGWLNILHRLPKCTYWEQTPWPREMARCFDDLADDLAAGTLPYPRSLAEELALILSLNDARDAMSDHNYGREVTSLPTHDSDDDWDSVADDLLPDRDMDAFYSDDRSEVATWVAMRPPETWFLLFEWATARDARRGFRR